jgi:hypothetical protein
VCNCGAIPSRSFRRNSPLTPYSAGTPPRLGYESAVSAPPTTAVPAGKDSQFSAMTTRTGSPGRAGAGRHPARVARSSARCYVWRDTARASAGLVRYGDLAASGSSMCAAPHRAGPSSTSASGAHPICPSWAESFLYGGVLGCPQVEVKRTTATRHKPCLNGKNDMIVLPLKYDSRLQDQRHDS